MKNKRYLLCVAISIMSMNLFASTEQEKIYLTQILNQLNAMKPLIVAAAYEQPKTNRIQFHYTSYKDATGKSHNGLLNDVNEIENGIQEKLNHIPEEPHILLPLKGDYIEHHNKVEHA